MHLCPKSFAQPSPRKDEEWKTSYKKMCKPEEQNVQEMAEVEEVPADLAELEFLMDYIATNWSVERGRHLDQEGKQICIKSYTPQSWILR